VVKGIDSVRAGDPEAVVMVGPYAPLAEIVKRGKKSGWNPLYLTVSFVGTEAFMKEAGEAASGTVITQVVPPYTRVDLPTVVFYLTTLKKYAPGAEPSFVSFEGFVDALVLVEGLKRAGHDLSREKLIEAIESIKDKDIGLGSRLTLSYSATDHSGFHRVYYSVVRAGRVVAFTDWMELKKSQ
jgi:ABC-type branched-subunit amino acid transport system substrate-binding protein